MYSKYVEQKELFSENEKTRLKDVGCPFHPNVEGGVNGPDDLAGLFELSVDAYYTAIFASMSELPIKAEISRFVEKVYRAGKLGGGACGERIAAEKAVTDRGDPDVLTVLKAAGKVQHEIHRLTGFLRFSEGAGGVYIARCSPDHYVLPALAEHFTQRFGQTSWVIVDEKRGLCLCREKGAEARIATWSPLAGDSPVPAEISAQNHPWEDLWRLYHRSVSIKSRKNLHLQRQLMPERYRKYLTEIDQPNGQS